MSNTVSRRRFLQTGAGSVVGLAAAAHSSKAATNTSEPIEAIVIGSGFGGAVAAYHLAKAGIHTLVLERGRRWSIPDKLNQDVFSSQRTPDGRSTWLSPFTVLGDHQPIDVYTGVLDVFPGNGVVVSRGAGVGGGSLCYAGIMYQPVKKLFDLVFNHSLDYDEMASVYYPRVRAMLNNPAPIPQDILATDFYKSARYLLHEGKIASLNTYLLNQNIDWDVVRMEIAGERVPSAINGEFWYGNNSGCKNTLDRNYLQLAEETGYVDIVPLHVVTSVSATHCNYYTVETNMIDTNGTVLKRQVYTCKYLFMSAGSVGTPQLLVRARDTKAMPYLNKHVGQYWGTNGDTLTVQLGLSYSDAGNPGAGGPAGGVMEDHTNPLGPIILEPLSQFEAPFNPTQNTSSMFFLAMGIPPPKGYFTYDQASDSVGLTWPINDPAIQQTLTAGNNSLANVNASLNKTGVPAFSPPVGGGLSAHPLGGMVLGKATDMHGRVAGYRNLFVVDGSLIPGSAGCTNPSLTIAAIAERCMDGILRDLHD